MDKELKINYSKKLIIEVSILFCTVILIIGGSIAFFTQSDSESTGDIVTTDEVTLDYQDNDDYMLGELIPINENDLDAAYNNKCKDNLGYNVCSIYQFTITNTGNVTQDIIINMHPKVNGFTNLKFNLIDITNNETIIKNKQLILNSEEPITLKNDLRLDTNNNKSNTYEILFYIKNDPNNDQSHLDAGVRFGANIEVNSVTTGFNVIKDLGDPGCWKADENDPTIISEFIGYKDNNGNEKFDETDELKKECEKYFKKDTDNYYIVNIPSEYGGYNFTKTGNFLLAGGELDERFDLSSITEYRKIKNISIDDDIIMIGEFVGGNNLSASFAFIGIDIEDPDYNLEIKLPKNLTTIGNSSFMASRLKILNIPENVKIIGLSAFSACNITTTDAEPLIIPESVTYIGKSAFASNSNLTKLQFSDLNTEITDNNQLIIEEDAFNGCGLDYRLARNPLELPNRLIKIGKKAFLNNNDLYFVKYHGLKNNFNTFGNNGSDWTSAKYVRIADEYNVEEAKTYEIN